MNPMDFVELEQKARAWEAVHKCMCELDLFDILTEEERRCKCGMDVACDVLRKLAKERKEKQQ